MSQQFQRDYLVRLPLPLAQLYSRAFNAKDARARHDNAFYLCESLVKLAAAPAVACYLQEVESGQPRVAALDRLLAQLALPSLGQWVAMLRELSRQFGARSDSGMHPLGRLWMQLTTPRRDLAGIVALFRRIKNGPDGQPAGDQSCTLLELFEALVQYRNGVFGHGAGRFDAFYVQEMGPLLFPAVNDLLKSDVFDWLGPQGSRLVFLSEVRTLANGRSQVELRELIGLESERLDPLELDAAMAATLLPGKVAVLWPGRPIPLRLDPLLQYRETDLTEEMLFLNRDRNGRQVEYLSYATGRTERDRSMAAALAALLSRVTSRPVQEADLERLGVEALVEAPPDKAPVAASSTGPNGDFEILAEIGRGGMGVVFLARQLSLGQLVALKVLPAELAGDEIALARFKREIRHLARCEHPNIIKVFSSGVLPDGRMYYTMEYVPGSDLEMIWRELAGPNRHGVADSLSDLTWARSVLTASRKGRDKAERSAGPGAYLDPTSPATSANQNDTKTTSGANASSPPPANAKHDEGPDAISSAAVTKLLLAPLPDNATADDSAGGYVRRVAEIIRDAAFALQAVHEQGIVHRDVKPGNLVLTPDSSRIVLMDFGLAKGQSISASISHTAGFLGTLRYAAPEQLAAATLKVGPTADIRGLGATMWELLTRERLFGEAEDEAQLAYRIHEEDVPPLRSVDPTLDRDLEAIVARATERRVSDRIQSAALLAEYLQLYLDGKPLPIRQAGMVERSVRWARKHKEFVAAAVLLIVALVGLGAWSLVHARRDEAAQLVSTLLAADTETVPQVVNELQHHWSWAAPLLREQMASVTADPDKTKEKLNLSLALLPHDPSQTDYLLGQMLQASPSHLRIIRTALEPQALQLAPKLWAILSAEPDKSGQFLRTACALADFDPSNPRWAEVAPHVAKYLVAENVLLVGQWQERLRPVQKALVPPLAAISADPHQPSEQRDLAIALLSDYAADDPDTLARLIVATNPKQYASLFPLLEKHRARILELMAKKLAEVTQPEWNDPALNAAWTGPDTALVSQIEAARGILAERFALCHALPLTQFSALAESLGKSGYRPICFRPYMAAGQTLVAAVWKRDGQPWQCVQDVSADEVKLQAGIWRQHGFLPHDVACYSLPGTTGADVARYAALWARPKPEMLDEQLDAGISGDDNFKKQRAIQEKAGYMPRTLVRVEQNGETPLYCAVWSKPRKPVDRDSLVYDCGRDRAWYESKQTPSRVEDDVRLAVAADASGANKQGVADPASSSSRGLQYSAVFHESPQIISDDVCGLPLDQALARCRQLAAAGYRPVSISAVVAQTGEPAATASVWHLPAVPDATTEALAMEQAVAAATLLRLNQPESVWPLFHHTPDPRLRTDLIHQLSLLGAAPEPLIDRLGVETDISARRALILCLGEFTDKQFNSDGLKQLVETLRRLYLADPDSGIHSAAEWVLRRWGYESDVQRASGDSALRVAGPRAWYVTEHGFTMAVVAGPSEFMMGSPGTEMDRYKQEETMHRERIPRSFAIATKKVTVAQFKQFQSNFSYPTKYSAAADGPIVSVTWFDAVRYCQWLSEQEKIPPSQWCYPPLSEIKEKMQLPAKYLSRTGYRLPTEAEWEFACRAGAATSRYFGQSRDMLNNYAWTFHNSAEGDLGEHAWPVGQLKPNDFGLFDIHGNVWEWCANRYLPYPQLPRTEAVEDVEDTLLEVVDAETDRRVLRGGSFLNRAPIVRSAARNRYRPSTANYYVGLRIVRTLAPDAAAMPPGE